MATLTADQVSARLAAAKSPEEVDAAVLQMIDEGELSDWFQNTDGWPTITIRGPNATGGTHTLKAKIAPTYASLGVDSYPIGRGTPYLAQAIAQRVRSVMPSRKLVLEAQAQSNPKIPYVDVKAPPANIPGDQIATQGALDAAAKGIRKAFADRGAVPGEGIVYGYRKSIVSAPKLDGQQVAIVGGVYADGKPVQPFSTIHSAKGYSDDSQADGPYYLDDAELNGEHASMHSDVFLSMDPTVVALVNDYHSAATGKLERYDPDFPNASKDTATFSVITGEDDETDFSSFGVAVGKSGAKITLGGLGIPQEVPEKSPSLIRGAVGALAGGLAAIGVGFAAPGIAIGIAFGGGIAALSSVR